MIRMSEKTSKKGFMDGLVGGLVRLIGPPTVDIIKFSMKSVSEEDIASISELINNVLDVVGEKPDTVLGVLSNLDTKAVVKMMENTTAALGNNPEIISNMVSGIMSELDFSKLIQSSLPLVMGLAGPVLDIVVPILNKVLDMLNSLLQPLAPYIDALFAMLDPIINAISAIIDPIVSRVMEIINSIIASIR
jgi:hypothetical protein